ncbi:MAG: hypothetical protein QM579_08455 [Desulfovibrio sp.]|uniref:hypothetical protein n=1 Tax=Desulfovibrio sp. TaxID=885 RepID=UPI0039E2783E
MTRTASLSSRADALAAYAAAADELADFTNGGSGCEKLAALLRLLPLSAVSRQPLPEGRPAGDRDCMELAVSSYMLSSNAVLRHNAQSLRRYAQRLRRYAQSLRATLSARLSKLSR